jgi:TRAP-type mannitol/chloroaromatic compound transport system permease small subunit
MEVIDTSSIEKQWGLYALLFHAKQTAAYDLHASEYVRVNEITSKEVIKNQREYLEENYSEFVKENKDTETKNKKVIH